MSDAIRKVVGFATILLGILATFSVATFTLGYSSQKNTLSENLQSILFIVAPFIAAWLLLSNHRSRARVAIGYLLAASCFGFLLIYG